MRIRTFKGFTLIELMVAMALTGILSIIVYTLFDSASDSLGEVDSLMETNDQLRFAMEQLRGDIEAAGSQATPDSANDQWVRPTIPAATGRILGITGYNAWQDQTTHFDTAANPDVSADGFVVMGAYDYPVSFEFGGMTGPGSNGRILATPRGFYKLFSINPFQIQKSFDADFSNNGFVNQFAPQWDARLLRVMDSEGYFQFATPGPISTGDFVAGGGLVAPSVTIPIVTASGPQLVFKNATAIQGLDVDRTGETYYDSALIDAYWYHVVPSVQQPGTNQLVRDRLCAAEVFSDLSNPATFDPSTARSGSTTCGSEERVVIAERVADFQIWFDCGTVGGLGNVAVTGGSGNWTDDWAIPDAGDCMDVSGTYQPELARFAHIRLTIHAESERENLAHFRFEDSAGNTGTSVTDSDARLRTYDIVPDLEGAAPVATMQSAVELRNFSYRL